MKHYFTFGIGHTERPSYTVVEADDADAARKAMFDMYDARWAFQYDDPVQAGVYRFDLIHIPFGSHIGLIKEEI